MLILYGGGTKIAKRELRVSFSALQSSNPLASGEEISRARQDQEETRRSQRKKSAGLILRFPNILFSLLPFRFFLCALRVSAVKSDLAIFACDSRRHAGRNGRRVIA